MSSKKFSPNFLDYLETLKQSYTGPTYIFNKTSIKEKLNKFELLSKKHNVKVIMALKSFNNPEIYKLCAQSLSGFDISNNNEYELAKDYIDGKFISMIGPIASASFITNQLKIGEQFYFDISTQSQLKEALNLDLKNFGVRLKVNEENSDEAKSRFGFSFEEIKQMIPTNKIEGFHFHKGYRSNTLEYYLETTQKILDFAKVEGINLRYINCGGGLKYTDPEKLMVGLRSIAPASVDLIIEPGDFLFADSGYFLTKISSLNKVDENHFQVTLDSSGHCHLKWSDPHLVMPHNLKSKESTVELFGATCFEGDFMGKYCIPASEEDLAVGQFVVYGGVSSYSHHWNHEFNGVKKAQFRFYEEK